MAWANSVAITIDHTKVPNTDQTNFPIMFVGKYPQLATVANGGSITNSNGYDIIFASDSLGSTVLNFERAAWNSKGDSVFYVQIPTLSHTADTTIYILFGNSSIVTDQQHINATWDSNYNAVWHFCQPSTTLPSSLDSTINANNGQTPYPINIGTGPGMLGQISAKNNGTSSPISVLASSSWSVTDASISAWVKTTTNQGGIFQIQNSNPLIYISVGPTTAGGSNNVLVAYFRTNSGSVVVSSGTTSLVDGVWHHVYVTRSTGVNILLYVDGVLNTTTSYTDSGTIDASATPANLLYAGTKGLNGICSDVRFSKIVRSSDWIVTEFNNQNSPYTFYSTTLTRNSMSYFDWINVSPAPINFSYLVNRSGILPQPIATNLAGGIVGTSYAETISVTGGTTPYTFSITSGSLPTGTSLNSSTGLISGTPTTTGTYNFTIKSTDSRNANGSYNFQIVVASASSGGAGPVNFGFSS